MSDSTQATPTFSPAWRFWLFGLALFMFLLWLLAPMLTPFVLGLAIAYFLDPVVDRLQRWRWPRWAATSVVLLGFLLLVIIAILLLVPLFVAQIGALIDALPGYAETARAEWLPWIERTLATLSPDEMERLKAAASNYAGDAVGFVANMLKGLLSGGMAIFDVLTLLVITPVVAFYLLRDWDDLMVTLNAALPRHTAEIVREQAQKIDQTLAGFVRGQALVCLCLGTLYGVGLSMVGLNFGAAIGFMAGILSFIPYVGSLFGLATSVVLAFIQFDSWQQIVPVLLVFAAGQVLEGNVLTPKLVGDRVGLHPVMIMFAIMAGGVLFGFLGVLVAVPFAAVLGVGLRFALAHYRQSRLYLG